MKKTLVLAAVVAMAVPGMTRAGGGFGADPGAMFGGLEQSYGFDAGSRRAPDQRMSLLGAGRWGAEGHRGGWRRPQGAPGLDGAASGPGSEQGPRQPGMHRSRPGGHRRRSRTTLLSPRLAMYWSRLDANGRTQLETYLRQWLASLTAEQNQSMLTAINGWWERMPEFQKQFLSQLYNNAATTSAAASPATTAATGTLVDPATGNAVDPTTGYPIDPTTGQLIDPSTGYRIDPGTGSLIDPATGSLISPATPTPTPAATGTTVDPITGVSVDLTATQPATSLTPESPAIPTP